MSNMQHWSKIERIFSLGYLSNLSFERLRGWTSLSASQKLSHFKFNAASKFSYELVAVVDSPLAAAVEGVRSGGSRPQKQPQ